jgi:DNA-3-methyladenine glycosylase
LRRNELPADTVALARFLLGKVLVRDEARGRTAARIVETEAYLPKIDAASHAYRGPTTRNRSMFLRRGHAYVYFIYGTWHCLNVTSETEGTGAAVLLRAAEPLEGRSRMQRRRKTTRVTDLARGPGRLAAAFGLERRHDGLDLCSPRSELWLAAGAPPPTVGESVRIGVSLDAHRVLRFFERGNPFVSGARRLNA